MKKFLTIAICALLTSQVQAEKKYESITSMRPLYMQSNETINSFNKAKKILEREVYYDHRTTLYCGATFDEKKNVLPPKGFTTKKYVKRSKRVEWEHVVPAESFGRAFPEWRDGHPQCVDSKGKSFKGRQCASKMNTEYRLMQADMYNLFPAIGAVNAMRSNYRFVPFIDERSSFGSCEFIIDGRKVDPPQEARGRIARAYLYMDLHYSKYHLSGKQRRIMQDWDRIHPATEWECTRADRIAKIQGNRNEIMAARCK